MDVLFRGNAFHTEFSKVGEIKSILPKQVNVMALTATATNSTRREICITLGMVKPLIVSRSPNKPNIYYYVSRKDDGLEIAFAPLLEEIHSN